MTRETLFALIAVFGATVAGIGLGFVLIVIGNLIWG
jgi:hypothetical protein